MSVRIELESFVILTRDEGDIAKDSIGIVRAINGKYAIVYFVGKNQMLRLAFDHIIPIDIDKTGKGYPQKICNICHILKGTNDFDVNQTDAKGRKTTRPSCKECRKTIDGQPLLAEEKLRMDEIKPQWHSVFVCPICEKRTIVGVTANLVRDHDHQTGKGRDWICDSCNTGLGRFKDNITFLQKVINYLKRF